MITDDLSIFTFQSYRGLKGTDEHYTWDVFLRMVGLRDLFTKLVNTTIFARGLSAGRGPLGYNRYQGIFRGPGERIPHHSQPQGQ